MTIAALAPEVDLAAFSGRAGDRATGTLKAAVIGVGAMGRNHVRVYTELDDVDLIAVADPSAANREKVERRFGLPAYEDYRRMLEVERPDLVTVAVPSAHHRRVALDVIGAGVNLLVE